MDRSSASMSILLFLVSLAMLGLLTLFESAFVGMPTAVERILSGLLLILPAAIGVMFGGLSLYRKEPKVWVAIAGILLNTGFAVFNLLILSFAG